MVTIAPKVHKYLSADALFASLRKAFSTLCDHRAGTPDIALSDALMSAFALFSLKSPSLLAFDKERAEDNLHQIYGIQRVPCDTSMREILDPVEPESLRPVFKQVVDQLQRGKALKEMEFVLVFRNASPQRHRDVCPSDVGGGAHPPRQARGHCPDA
jgi:hypothetical protein